MKVVVTVDNKIIVALIHAYLVSKLGEESAPKLDGFKVKVRSKQNYREHQFEDGEMQVTYEGEI